MIRNLYQQNEESLALPMIVRISWAKDWLWYVVVAAQRSQPRCKWCVVADIDWLIITNSQRTSPWGPLRLQSVPLLGEDTT